MSLLPVYFALRPLFSTLVLVCNHFLYKPFSKKKRNCFVGLKVSTSLWVEIPVGVRLPAAGSLQTPRKRDLHWELLLLLLYFCVGRVLHCSARDGSERVQGGLTHTASITICKIIPISIPIPIPIRFCMVISILILVVFFRLIGFIRVYIEYAKYHTYSTHVTSSNVDKIHV